MTLLAYAAEPVSIPAEGFMASCKCGGGACNCVVTEGPGATVTGAGATTNPYVVGAKVSPTPGNTLTIDPGGLFVPAGSGTVVDDGPGVTVTGTGSTATPYVVAADVSATPGNRLSIDADGLFVPEASVTTGCGLTGTGTAADPVAANTAALPVGCPETGLQDVYCRSDGTLATVPEKQRATLQIDAQPPGSGCLLINSLAADDGSFHTIATGTGSITNPSPCLPMTVRVSAGIRHAQYVAWGPGDNEIEIGTRVTLSGAINQVLTQLVAHQHWRAENVPDGDRWTFDSVGAYDDVEFTLAPGESVNVLLEGTLFNAQSSASACMNTPKFRLYAEGVND